MRVGPFSNEQVTDYIQTHFIPIYVSNEDYKSGKFGAEEQARLLDIRRKTEAKGIRAGSVQVYLVTSEQEVADALVVSQASQITKLMPFLRKTVEATGTIPGKPVVAVKQQSRAPATKPSQLALRITAQYRPRQKIMVEDWLVLDEEAWRSFLPPAAPTTSWKIPDTVTRQLLVRLYPYAQNWDHAPDQIHIANLNAKVLETTKDETVIGLRGELAMSRFRYVGSGKYPITTKLTGFVILKRQQKPELTIITEGARFGELAFDGLIQSARNAATP